MSVPAPRQLSHVFHITILAIVLALLGALTQLHWQGPPAATGTPSARAQPRGRSGLQSAAMAQIADAIGAQMPIYLVRRQGNSLDIRNPAQRLTAAFGVGGVAVSGDWGHFHIDFTGTGTETREPQSVRPKASANQVVYDRTGVRERYANSPLGIEQDFTVQRQSRPTGGTLTLRLAVDGDLQPKLMPGRRGIELARDGTPVLTYGQLAAHDARGVALASSMRLLGGQILLEVDTRGARYPLDVDPLIQAVPKLIEGTAEGVDGGDFGFNVALSEDGNTAVVGGPEYEKNDGAAWVFIRSGDSWVQQGPRLSGSEGSGFGESVAISADGNTIVAGGYHASGGGAVWIFSRSGETWSSATKIASPIAPTEGDFGETVALSNNGEVMFVGEPQYEDGRGAVWIYRKSSLAWVQEQLLAGPEPGFFGSAIAVSETGATAIIGALGANSFSGAAWVYQQSGTKWLQQGEALSGTEEEPYALKVHLGSGFGVSVAISADGNTALVGGFFDHNGAGALWAFTRSGTSWSQQGPKITAEGEEPSTNTGAGGFFGSSLALTPDGNTAIVGAVGDANTAGAAWVFKRSNERWIQQPGKLQGGEESEGGGFGNSVAIAADGRTALIGGGPAPEGAPPAIGGAWIFELESPSAVAGSASEIGASSATLQGLVDPDGSEVTECTIEYGPASSLVDHTPCSPISGAGTTPEAVTAQVSGLAAGTTYGFRVRAVTEGGVATSTTASFTTTVTPSTPSPRSNVPPQVSPAPLPHIGAHIYRSFASSTGIFGFLVVGEVPLGGYVVLTCHGKGCPFIRYQSPPRRSASSCPLPSASGHSGAVHECISLTAFLAHRRIRPGDTLTVEIERTGWISKRFTYRLEAKGKLSASGGQCLVAGQKPVRC